MKKLHALMMLGLLASATGAGAFAIPRGTHTIDELANAQAKAADRKKPVVFLFTKKALEPT